MKIGTDCSPAQRSASRISSTLVARRNQRAGPPIPMVVRGASGTFSSSSMAGQTIQDLYQRRLKTI
jgi:hypothetical protein